MSEFKYKFNPQKDITTYDIALLLAADWKYQIISEAFLDSFPESVQSHFEKIEN